MRQMVVETADTEEPTQQCAIPSSHRTARAQLCLVPNNPQFNTQGKWLLKGEKIKW